MNLVSFEGVAPKLHPSVFVTDGIWIIGDVEIGEGSSVWYGSVIRGDVHYVRIGREVSVQDGTIIHVTNTLHPTIVGDRVVIGHRVVLHGCTVGSNILVGMGAVIMDGAVIGDNCVVAAGALVTPGTVVPAGSVVMGSPARVVRPAGADILKKVDEGIRNYRDLIARCRKAR